MMQRAMSETIILLYLYFYRQVNKNKFLFIMAAWQTTKKHLGEAKEG